jgi:hypothetical protein
MKNPSERILVWLLRLSGAVMLLAFAAMLMPTDWMAANHRRLGMGSFPESTLVDYLTRSISALYGIHGGLYLVVSMRVKRYADLILYLGVMNVLFGLLMIGIDLHAGMPLFWTLVEGPSVIVVGALFVALTRKLPAD